MTFGGNSLTLVSNSGQATIGGNFTDFDQLTVAGSLALGADTTLTGAGYSLPSVTGNRPRPDAGQQCWGRWAGQLGSERTDGQCHGGGTPCK